MGGRGLRGGWYGVDSDDGMEGAGEFRGRSGVVMDLLV